MLGRLGFNLAALSVASLLTGAQAPSATASPVHRVDRTQLMNDVRELSSPEFDGRRTASVGGIKARAWIATAFQAIGLKPAGTKGFTEPFSFTYDDVRDGARQAGRSTKVFYKDAANLLGVVHGTSPGAKFIVVSAHYDHLGNDGVHVFPGADDNASGVATLLAAARWFTAHPPRHPMLFAAFDAEELGLKGAQAFVASGLAPASKIALDVNMDMVSRNDRNEIFATGTYQEAWLKPILRDVQQRAGVKVLFGHDRPSHATGADEDWTELSDQGAFRDAKVPFLYFGVEDHADYHQPTDTADKIDPRFFGDAADMILDALVTLDARIH